MVKTLHAAGIEVILDVVYNHTAEGNDLRPDAVASRASTTPPTTGSTPTTRRRYVDYTGTGNSLNMRHPHVLQLIMDSLRYWVHRDARRRLPLRPRRHARPRAARRRPALGVLRPHPAGPGRQPGEAHRRAVGRRRGRLPGRQLPAAVVGVERQVPRRGPRLLARRRPHRRRVRLPLHRARRPLRVQRPHARRQHQLRHRPRRLHPRTTSSPTTTSTTRPTARTTATAPTTTARGTAASRARPTTPAILALRAPPAPQPAGHAAALPGRARCCSAATSSAAPRAATTTPTARTTRSPGSTGTAPTTTCSSSPAASSRCAAPTRCSAAAAGSRAGRSWARHIDDIGWFTPAGAPMTDDDWQVGFARSIGVFLNGEAIPGQGPRGERIVDDSFFVVFNASDDDEDFHPPRRDLRHGLERGPRHRARRRAAGVPPHAASGSAPPARRCGSPPARRCCCERLED